MTKLICESMLAKRPILYTDTIEGKQCLCDDMWAVTTLELNENHAFIAQYAGDLQKAEAELKFLRKAIQDIRLPQRIQEQGC